MNNNVLWSNPNNMASFLLGIGCFKGQRIKQRERLPSGATAACSNPAVQNSLEQKNPRSNRPGTFAPCSEGADVNI
ncbi:hypothetical protein CEXT_543431 [Caerostris extrusa]|uniref:Uncharacterized protein n=1 Tax=Caerostris extrusa TaxID=172846 RepID=A0AAV4VNI4_CAEEX|nr:hypothetical protein CEXT_543431 [Caerostris extrusa]